LTDSMISYDNAGTVLVHFTGEMCPH
jgi:hypothetical protein